MGISPYPAGSIPAVVRIPVTDDKVARQIIQQKFDPEFHKVPVTKEYMAQALGGNVEVKNLAVMDCFSDALYESIAGMIFKLARKYAFTCGRDEITDLAHDCVLRIFKMIHQYDPSKAKFNTWAWYVASSVLNRKYQKTRRYDEHFIDTDEPDNYGHQSKYVKEINGDVVVALMELFEMYPERRDILTELFCRDDGSLYVPDRISMRKVAESLSREYSDVYLFVRNKVRPFVAEKFGV